jgi:H+/gluconate symporter-like permease
MEGENNQNMEGGSGSSAGPVIGIIIILAIIVLGALYFWNQRDAVPAIENAGETSELTEMEEESNGVQSPNLEVELEGAFEINAS